MSPSVELQTAIYQLLTAPGSATMALAAGRVYDNVPGSPAFPYVSFGPSDHVEDDADGIPARVETLQLDGWTRDSGKLRGARELADAIKADLHGASFEFTTNALVQIRVRPVRVFRDPDGITGHAVVPIEATIEEV
uniref:DUF3168 domain-containing protein n=1 Tax=Cereibacter sphaeroides (strain ATCC 17025 / ATH 2.4.3) TaxID=349102 RepID=A4WTD6_CERS5